MIMHSVTLLLSALMFLATFTSAFTDNFFMPRDTNFTSFLASDTTTLSRVLAAVPASCGKDPGPCNQNGCYGINLPAAQTAMCTQGQYSGCQCQPTCKKGIKCSDSQCKGKNNPNGGGGMCEGGHYAGCECDSDCDVKSCDSPDCQGMNNLRGLPGTCLEGAFYGCDCPSECGDHDGSCDSNDCQGENGACTSGSYKGCSCDSKCGDLEAGLCNANGCKGVNSPSVGLGLCTSGSIKGCPCINNCPRENLACGDSQCKGFNEVCTSGEYNGCNCK